MMTQPLFDARMEELRARIAAAADWREGNALAAERTSLEIARPDLAADYHARREAERALALERNRWPQRVAAVQQEGRGCSIG